MAARPASEGGSREEGQGDVQYSGCLSRWIARRRQIDAGGLETHGQWQAAQRALFECFDRMQPPR